MTNEKAKRYQQPIGTPITAPAARETEEDSTARLQRLLEALPETTPRGFCYVKIPYQDYPSEPVRELTVQESSLATENRLWVGPAGGEYRMHLNEDVVRQLRDALTAWLEAGA